MTNKTPRKMALKITDNAKNNLFVGCKVTGGVEIDENAEGNKFIQTDINSGEVPNQASSPSTQPTNNKKNWQDKVLYYIAVGVIIAVLAFFVGYLIKKHLGISL